MFYCPQHKGRCNCVTLASNEHVDFRKIENFVRCKRKTNFRKPCKNFKIVDEVGTEGTKL